MSLDDLVLRVQRAVDRLICRWRPGGRPEVGGRRFVIVQIDGLSRAALEEGLRAGCMPFLQRLLERERYHLLPMSVGLPTTTPAFQLAAMYGVRPDIPGFHYYDRRRGGDVHFVRRGHAAHVEATQSAGRPGILEGGSAYGCVFTGGAANHLFTLASLTRSGRRGLRAALAPFVIVAWVCAKSLVGTAVALARALPRFVARGVDRGQVRRWIILDVVVGIWVRNFFTMAAARDIGAGVPAIYVNYVDHDEAAHAFGPRSREALEALRPIDRAIGQLWSAARRVPEHRYDLYVLADHGQAPCRWHGDLIGGRRFERWVFEELLGEPPDQGRADLEAHEQDGVRVISAGPNAFLYLVGEPEPVDVEALARRFPALAERLSLSQGVGFVLARSARGTICFWRGGRYHLPRSAPPIFTDRADAAQVIAGLEALMAMPSAGDLVIYGTWAHGGHVSFLPERGGHAGPSGDELQTFVVTAPEVELTGPIDHPVQLYPHFRSYRR